MSGEAAAAEEPALGGEAAGARAAGRLTRYTALTEQDSGQVCVFANVHPAQKTKGKTGLFFFFFHVKIVVVCFSALSIHKLPPVLVSWGSHNNMLPTEWLKTTEIYCLIGLEA